MMNQISEPASPDRTAEHCVKRTRHPLPLPGDGASDMQLPVIDGRTDTGLQTNKPRLLDLFCGAGGAGMGYFLGGFDVTGVDINPQPSYPFRFYQDDALHHLRLHWHEYDAIHASPPCQHYSMMQRICKNPEKYPDLVDATRLALLETGKPFVIENVVGAPLRVDLLLCGSMFGLGIIRHRIFESNVAMPLLTPSCHHDNVYDPWHYGTNQLVELSRAMKISWMTKRQEVREAIPPAYTEYVSKHALYLCASRGVAGR